jgi:hypothetical protein
MDDLGWIPSLDQVIGLLETDKTLSMFGGKQQVKKLEKFGHVD